VNIRQVVTAWNALPSHLRFGIPSGVALLGVAVVGFLLSGGRPCGTRADVEARVAELTSSMQADAAAGKIAIEELATRVKKVNAAATAFDTSKDLPAYCASLDDLTTEFSN
jgi:hypothetical protein